MGVSARNSVFAVEMGLGGGGGAGWNLITGRQIVCVCDV